MLIHLDFTTPIINHLYNCQQNSSSSRHQAILNNVIYYLEEPPDNESGEVDFSLPNPSDEVTIAFLWNSVHTFSLEAPHTSKLLWGKNGLNRPWGFKPFNVLGLKCNWVAQNCSSIHAGKWVLKLELGWPRKLQQKNGLWQEHLFWVWPRCGFAGLLVVQLGFVLSRWRGHRWISSTYKVFF